MNSRADRLEAWASAYMDVLFVVCFSFFFTLMFLAMLAGVVALVVWGLMSL